MGDEGHRWQYSGEDFISGLPDELLHGILVRLRSARAAARTSVLSRRWRHVLAHLPELHLGACGGPEAPPPASLPDAVDAALDSWSAPALDCLCITLSPADVPRVAPSRIARWLGFASQHVVDELHLYMPALLGSPVYGEELELQLPVCARAKTIKITLQLSWRLRTKPDGLFNPLTITFGRMEASELTALVSKHCRRLVDLRLIVRLVAVSDVSVLSDSLQSLLFFVEMTH